MRDDSAKWTAPRADQSYANDGIAIKPVTLARQMLLSGPDVLNQLTQPLIEWTTIATSESYALCLRRDRVLLINGPDMPEGWHEAKQQAISDVTDAYAVFDLSGEKAMNVLSRGTEISLSQPSRSVARQLFGIEVFVYRISGGSYRVHVASAQAEALYGYLACGI